MKHQDMNLRLDQIQLDQENPRFPTVANQREAIHSMLTDQGDKIVNLAGDIYENGLNPSTRLIVFTNGTKYIDGDGNRRITAIKILEPPSLCDEFPALKRKLSAILKGSGSIPNSIGCVALCLRFTWSIDELLNTCRPSESSSQTMKLLMALDRWKECNQWLTNAVEPGPGFGGLLDSSFYSSGKYFWS